MYSPFLPGIAPAASGEALGHVLTVCRYTGIPAAIKKTCRRSRRISDKWAAIVWMCRNQLGRRNITDEQRTALIGEAYKAQKMTQGGDRGTDRNKKGKFTARDQNGLLTNNKTRKEIAKQFSVGEGTVQRAEQFVDGLNAAEKVSPGIKDAVLSGAVKAPKQMIAETATETETVTPKPQQGDGDKLRQETAGKTVNRLRRNG